MARTTPTRYASPRFPVDSAGKDLLARAVDSMGNVSKMTQPVRTPMPTVADQLKHAKGGFLHSELDLKGMFNQI